MGKMLEYIQARLRGEIPPPGVGTLIGLVFTAVSEGHVVKRGRTVAVVE